MDILDLSEVAWTCWGVETPQQVQATSDRSRISTKACSPITCVTGCATKSQLLQCSLLLALYSISRTWTSTMYVYVSMSSSSFSFHFIGESKKFCFQNIWGAINYGIVVAAVSAVASIRVRTWSMKSHCTRHAVIPNLLYAYLVYYTAKLLLEMDVTQSSERRRDEDDQHKKSCSA